MNFELTNNNHQKEYSDEELLADRRNDDATNGGKDFSVVDHHDDGNAQVANGQDGTYHSDAQEWEQIPQPFQGGWTLRELQPVKRSRRFGSRTNGDLADQYEQASKVIYSEPPGVVDESQQERLFEYLESISENHENHDVFRKTNRAPNARLYHQVLKRDNYRCVHCGRSPAKDINVELHVDHIKPWSKGGETVLENLQTLCATCNLGKSNIE